MRAGEFRAAAVGELVSARVTAARDAIRIGAGDQQPWQLFGAQQRSDLRRLDRESGQLAFQLTGELPGALPPRAVLRRARRSAD